ncbi:MAG: hypothetical protein JOZ54_12245, partial [Acidobacteria bacterium]|nr:hypothetical protein [Acidobacteriota bacterium]
REKVAELCRQNPWLQGKLAKKDGKVWLRYPKVAEGIDRYLRVTEAPSLRFETGFAEFADALKDLTPKRGYQCIGKDEDLFRIVVVKISEERFALVMAMSHVFSDAHTFYQVHTMLSSDAPVRPLIVDRVYTSLANICALIPGGHDTLGWMMSPGFLANMAGPMLLRRKPKLHLFTVNQDAINERKKEYEATNKPKYISSNDVLTSDLFFRTGCDLILTSVNFRGRIADLTNDHAGNYQSVIAYQREDFASPELVRTGAVGLGRPMSGKLPGFFRSLKLKLGAITNSAGFYQDVQLPGCKLLAHRPVIIHDAPLSPFEHIVYIFKSRNDQMAVITGSRDPSALSKLDVLQNCVV